MYVLEIETKNHLKKIKNPRRAVAKDLMVWSIVKVMDGDGNWHFIGHCFFPTDAEDAAYIINDAICDREKDVYLYHIS